MNNNIILGSCILFIICMAYGLDHALEDHLCTYDKHYNVMIGQKVQTGFHKGACMP